MLDCNSFPMMFDGAFGTYYFALTGDARPCELANLHSPDVVRQIHREYIAAGAQAIKTNTFGANSYMLPKREKLAQLLETGWKLACEEAAPHGVRVFADIGGTTGDEAAESYLAVAEEFCRIGAKNFLFETLAEFTPLLPALARIRVLCPDATVIVSFAAAQDGFTRRGLHYRVLMAQALAAPEVDAVGLNCACGPTHLLALLRALPPSDKPICAMPNAGYPSSLNGRMVFEDNADYFAGRLAELYRAGADLLGGCCGSTPRHIALGLEAVRRIEHPRPAQAQVFAVRQTDLPERSSRSVSGRKLVAVELDPPQNSDCGFMLDAAATLRSAGADIITVADSPLSRARADSVMTAARIQREIGIQVMPHLACRDRNRIALKASLLGAAFEGINRVLVITGDPPAGGEEGVFCLNSYQLIEYIMQISADTLADSPIVPAAALNVNAVNFPAELARAQRKLACGASMLLTQPIFTEAAEQNFRRAAQELDCTLLAGILPVAGYRNALFLKNEVSGIDIPAALLDALKDATPEQAQEISIAYSGKTVERLFDVADGFYIMTPLKKTAIVQGLIQVIRDREENEQ